MEQQNHHAILFTGDRETGMRHAHMHIQSILNAPILGNPDVEIIVRDRFSINDARILKRRAAQTPFGSAQAFVIAANTILVEAQNALLKLLEEPSSQTHFFIIVPSSLHLLPTVHSRLAPSKYVPYTIAEDDAHFAKTFLSSSVSERMRLVEPLIKEKDRAKTRSLVYAIEAHLRENGGVHSNAKSLTEILFVQNYLSDKASSLKMLLGHLSAVL